MTVADRPLSWFVDRIAGGPPLTFSRWGDGEWHAVLGRTQGKNCDGHPYTADLGLALRTVLKARPAHPLGMQPLAVRVMGLKIEAFLAANGLHDLDWVNADVFHNASRDGRLDPLVQVLRAKPLLLVGPPHLKAVEGWLGAAGRVEAPARNAFAALGRLEAKSVAEAAKLPDGGVVAVGVGMPAKVLVDTVSVAHGSRLHVVDFGSLWDPYCGVKSRKYMLGMDVALETGFDVDRPPPRFV